MTTKKIPENEFDLIDSYLPDYHNRDDIKRLNILIEYLNDSQSDDDHRGDYEKEFLQLNKKIFQEALINFHLQMMGAREKQIYQQAYSMCKGTLNSELKMLCVPSYKYRQVDLCLEDGWNYPVASIKLYNTKLWVDAEKTFEDASKLGEEISRRWNAFLPKGGDND